MEEAPHFTFYLLAGIIGLVVGIAEVASRYRDAPLEALRSPPSLLYLFANVGLAVLAFEVIRRTYGEAVEKAPRPSDLQLALGAGLGAVVIVRAKLLTVRVGDRDVAIGPGALVDGLLRVLDREIDRKRAAARVKIVHECLGTVKFDRAKAAVSGHLVSAMVSLSAEDKAAIGKRLGEVEAAELEDAEKALQTGYVVMDYGGEPLLRILFPKA